MRHVIGLLNERGLSVHNADITIVAQTPKLANYINKMCLNMAEDMKISETHMNVKATTTEGMGFEGRKEGISSHAVVLLNEPS